VRKLEEAGYTIGRNQQGNTKINVEISPLFALTRQDFLSKEIKIANLNEDIYME